MNISLYDIINLLSEMDDVNDRPSRTKEDYYNEIIPILKSSRISYVSSGPQYLKDKYNPRHWMLNHVTRMIYNGEDEKRKSVIYPYSFQQLKRHFSRNNISASVSLVKTKYHYWDEIKSQELFNIYYDSVGIRWEEIESQELFNVYHGSDRIRNANNQGRIIRLGDLKNDVTLPINAVDTCRVFFIVIKTNDGLTLFSKFFTPLFMPGLIKANNKLEVLYEYEIDEEEDDENKAEEDDENKAKEEKENKKVNTTPSNKTRKSNKNKNKRNNKRINNKKNKKHHK